jgi:hypothetical protein
MKATLATLRQRATQLLGDAEDALKYHNWEHVTACATLAGTYFTAYAAIGSTTENLTEIECPACVSAPCACAPA